MRAFWVCASVRRAGSVTSLFHAKNKVHLLNLRFISDVFQEVVLVYVLNENFPPATFEYQD
jgi:hypothetical protein